jgi:epoxyqueuosine reductase
MSGGGAASGRGDGETAAPVGIDPALLDALRAELGALGLARVGVVRLDHPGFAAAAAALRRDVTAGLFGEMEFMTRTVAVRADPAALLPGARAAVVAAAVYGGEPGPIARYAQGADYHTVMHRRMQAVEDWLRARLPGLRARIAVDTKPFPERAAAHLAGIGFLGKHGNLIVPGLGSWVVLGALVVDAPWLGPDAVPATIPGEPAPPPWSACGSCTRCLDGCPTAAFVGPGRLDARRCISYLTIEHRGPVAGELAARLGERVAGCDVCQEVCPYNLGPARGERARAFAAIDPRADGRAVEQLPLEELATLRSGRHRALVRGSALGRIPRRSLRRSALLALGNRGGELRPPELAAIEDGDVADDIEVRDAARWARARRSPPRVGRG